MVRTILGSAHFLLAALGVACEPVASSAQVDVGGGAAEAATASEEPDGWPKQFPIGDWTRITALATDSQASVYVFGQARASNGTIAARLRKYDAEGIEIWNRERVSTYPQAADFDSAGRAYLAGRDVSNADAGRFWVLSPGGERERSVELEASDGVAAISVGPSGYVNVGEAGSLARTYQYGPADDALWVHELARDTNSKINALRVGQDGALFVSGTMALAGANELVGYVRRIERNGTPSWSRTFASRGRVEVIASEVDQHGHVYVFGTVTDALTGHTHLGDYDTFLRRYSPEGELLWSRQFGSSEYDQASSLYIDANDRVLVAGWTDGTLREPGLGQSDGYVRAFDRSGETLWVRTIGTSQSDSITALAVDPEGRILVGGGTDGAFGDHPAGGVFVTRWFPEPR